MESSSNPPAFHQSIQYNILVRSKICEAVSLEGVGGGRTKRLTICSWTISNE